MDLAAALTPTGWTPKKLYVRDAAYDVATQSVSLIVTDESFWYSGNTYEARLVEMPATPSSSVSKSGKLSTILIKTIGDEHDVELLPGLDGDRFPVSHGMGGYAYLYYNSKPPKAQYPATACRHDKSLAAQWCVVFPKDLGLLAARAVVDTNGDLVVAGFRAATYTTNPTGAKTADLELVRVSRIGGHVVDRQTIDKGLDGSLVPAIIRRNKPGFFVTAGGVVYSLDPWFRHSCQASGACSLLPWATCDDNKPCTRDRCEPAPTGGHTCSHVPLPIGATCAMAGNKAVKTCGAKGCAAPP